VNWLQVRQEKSSITPFSPFTSARKNMEFQQSTERKCFAPRISPTKFHLSSKITDLDLDAKTQIPTAEHSNGYHPNLMDDINRMILAALQEQKIQKTL